MWHGHEVLAQWGRLINLISLIVYVCVVFNGLSVRMNMGVTWAICDILVNVHMVDWYVNDICWPGYQCDMYMAENRMICAWLNVICYTVWIIRECHVFARSGYWMDDIVMIGWVMYRNIHTELHSIYFWHTHMCYETTHSFPKNTFISYMQMGLQWFYNRLVEQVVEREWFTYLKISLNMWLKGRARMMAARDMITLHS